MMLPGRPGLWLFLAGALPASVSGADRMEEVVQIHREALGGAQRIGALAAIRATGAVIAGGMRVHFTMVAARPDKVRLETDGAGRRLVQASDGESPPWELDSGRQPPRAQTMSPASAKIFAIDAEFDDPLVAGASRGYSFDFAGESEAEGKHFLRVLVTRKLQETFSLLLDAETYLIVIRVEARTSAGGRSLQVITRYEDYRPVDGVLLAHRITVGVDGQATQQTVIDYTEPNPEIMPETFARPLLLLDPGTATAPPGVN